MAGADAQNTAAKTTYAIFFIFFIRVLKRDAIYKSKTQITTKKIQIKTLNYNFTPNQSKGRYTHFTWLSKVMENRLQFALGSIDEKIFISVQNLSLLN